jgi:hypothetical protein
VDLRVADLADPPPGGPFDAVISARAIHHPADRIVQTSADPDGGRRPLSWRSP